MDYPDFRLHMPDGQSVLSVVNTGPDGTPTHRYRLIGSGGEVVHEFVQLADLAGHLNAAEQ